MRRGVKIGLVVAAAAAALSIVAFLLYPNVVRVLLTGDSRRLRQERAGPPSALTARRSDLLVIALDGVGRDVLYPMLASGELPGFAQLLSGGGEYPHAYFHPAALSCLPSATMPGWAAFFTAAPPSHNGAPGDEFFIRSEARFAAPVPVSVQAPRPVAASYVGGYANELLTAPTVYETIRQEEPEVRIWVALSPIYRGADRLLLPSRTVLFEALHTALSPGSLPVPSAVISELDEEVVETVLDELESSSPPEVLTLYLPGADFVGHYVESPGEVQRNYLREAVDPQAGNLARALRERGALQDRFVVVVSDHGHTDLVSDEAHAIEPSPTSGPSAVLGRAGFRVRPFEWKTDDTFQAVLAYQGGMAFVYLAKRSTCEEERGRCDWRQAPGFERDVLPAAEALHQANRGKDAELAGTLDLILVRPGSSGAFRVYLGGGQTSSLEEHLARHPHPRYVAFEARLSELAVGPQGDRAGDLVLIPHQGNRTLAGQRYYFSPPQSSGHGSPSAEESYVPLIVAHARRSHAELRSIAEGLLDASPRPHHAGAMLLELRRLEDERGGIVPAGR